MNMEVSSEHRIRGRITVSYQGSRGNAAKSLLEWKELDIF